MTAGPPDRARRWSATLRLRIEQFAPALGELEANLDRIVAAQLDAARAGVDLLVTPELSLTGYDLRDRAHSLALTLADRPLVRLAEGPDVIVGLVERDAGFVPFNSAVHVRAGDTLFRHRKVYLPTYGMFDEGRFFGAGEQARVYDAGGGWRVGLLVCEDLWHPALMYLLAVAGAHLVIVQAAAAGRGAWAGGGGQGARFASGTAWEHLVRAAATAYGVYVVLANRVGVEASCVFAGGSLVVGPDGAVIARAAEIEAERLTVDLALELVGRARRPGSHARDEDAYLVHRELGRLLGERA